MRFKKLLLPLIYGFMMVLPCKASWPSLEIKVKDLWTQCEKMKKFETMLKRGNHFTVKDSSFHVCYVNYEANTQKYRCRFMVSYYQVKNEATNFNHIEAEGWLSRPTGKISEVSGDILGLASFISAIDSTKIKFKRNHLLRTSMDNKNTYAIWNYIDLIVPAKNYPHLIKILKGYLDSCKKENTLMIYLGTT